MLKLYVQIATYLRASTDNLKQLSTNRNESGFAAAEQIALAVAGVLIVGVAYAVFTRQIGSEDGGLLGRIRQTFDKF